MSTTLLIRPSATRLTALEPMVLDMVEPEDLCTIPLSGTVAAGRPLDIFEEAEALEVPAAWVTRSSYALRVRGDSMIGDDIRDGDIIIVEQRTCADNGETVVARINGDQPTLKRLHMEQDHIRLEPANPDMKALVLRHDEVEVLGIVKVVVRRT
jgi:repressor LexA